MNTRRVLLLAGTAVASLSALPAWAKRRHAAAAAGTASGDEGGPSASMPAVSSPADTPIGPVDTVATHAIVIDFNTGAVLLTKDPDSPSPPSSLTKLMTIYITFQQLKAGKLRLDQTFLISEHAWHMGGSRMFVQVGTNVTIEDLIRGIFVDSGNDAAVALAEGIGGTEDNFAAMMNAEAAKLGLTHSHFLNASGWPADGHVMSVRDIATLSEHIIRDFPEYYHYAGEQTFTYNKITQQKPQPAGHRRARRRPQDRSYGRGRLLARGHDGARLPPHHRGAQRLAELGFPCHGIEAADGLGLQQFPGRSTLRRRRPGDAGAGLAG